MCVSNPLVGLCVVTAPPTCPSCTGTCVPALFPGNPPHCVQQLAGAPPSCTPSSGCGSSNGTCYAGTCVSCGPLCGLLSGSGISDQSTLLAQLAAGGSMASAFTSIQTSTQVNAAIDANGALAAAAGAVLQ